jgi:heat shock protein HtpX
MWNNTKTLGLMLFMTFMIMLLGARFGQNGITIALIIAACTNFIGYFFSDKLALAMSGAQEVAPGEIQWYHDLVAQLAMKAGIPKPRLYIINNPSPNAFATGRNPEHSAVAISTGLVSLLTKEEIEGVLAHELAHVLHRDILTSTIVATMAATITWLGYMIRWGMFFGGFGGNRDDDRGGNPLAMLFMAILFPIAAALVQLAVSRSREYAADEGGARISGKPWALANALRKIEGGVRVNPMDVNPATAHMYIMQPFAGEGMMSLFSTHPPTAKRIEKLMAMTL